MEIKGRRLIGEILVDLGFIALPQVNDARRRQMLRPNVLLGEYLVELGFVTPNQLLEALARQTEELYPGFTTKSGKDLPTGLPARAFEIIQLVRRPLFQHIADQMEQGLIVEAWGLERAQDRILFINAPLATWLGMNPEAFREKPAVSVISFVPRFFEQQEELSQLVTLYDAHPTEPRQATLEVAKPQRMTLDVRIFPLKDPCGEAIGIFILCRRV